MSEMETSREWEVSMPCHAMRMDKWERNLTQWNEMDATGVSLVEMNAVNDVRMDEGWMIVEVVEEWDDRKGRWRVNESEWS